MSIDKTDYFMIGVKLKYNDAFELIDDYEGELDYVADYMGGEYIVIGKILDKGNYYDGFSFKSYDINELSKLIQEVTTNLYYEMDISEKPMLYTFTNWS